MSDSPCQVCGKPGTVQGAPWAPYSGCWCPDHVPAAQPAGYLILKALLILAILAIVGWKIVRRFL